MSEYVVVVIPRKDAEKLVLYDVYSLGNTPGEERVRYLPMGSISDEPISVESTGHFRDEDAVTPETLISWLK